jgi:dolichyl-phosphate-mannose-protein mannosyltransferase
MRTDGRWWPIALAWIAVVAGLALWLAGTPPPVLRDELTRSQFWALEAQFLAVVGLGCLTIPALFRSLALRGRGLVVPAAIAGLAFALAAFLAPRTNRIYYDEQIYQNIARNFVDLRLAQMCNDGNVEYGTLQCARGEYNKQPYGFPYLLSVAFRIGGVGERAAFAVNPIAAALTVWAVFLLTLLLTERPDAAAYASLITALMPDYLRWAHTTAAEPSAALACALAVVAALAFARLRSTTSLLWLSASCAFALQFRPECALVLPVVGLVILFAAPNEFGRPRFWWAALAGVALASVHIGHLVAVRNEGWGASGDRLSTSFVRLNLGANGWFYAADGRFPVVYTLLALLALLLWKPRRAIVVPAVFFLLFWGIFLFFYAGSYNYGADDRYSLMSYPAIAVLAGVGAAASVDAVSRRLTWTQRRLAGRVVFAALVVQFLWYAPFVRAVGEEAWGARADVNFARDMVRDLPTNAIVLTHNPNMFHVWGRNAAQLSLVSTDPYFVQRITAERYAGGVYFHWNFWCNVADPSQRRFCDTALARYPHTLVREYRERSYRFAFYRLESAAPASPAHADQPGHP